MINFGQRNHASVYGHMTTYDIFHEIFTGEGIFKPTSDKDCPVTSKIQS